MTEQDVIEIHAGRFRVVVGGDVAVTAAEVTSSGDMTRLPLGDLPGVTTQFASRGEQLDELDALVVVDDAAGGAFELDDGDIVVSTTGDPDIVQLVESTGASTAASILAEAAAVAWRQRLSDAADLLPQLTRADADIVGRLALPGKPKLLELQAERRQAFTARPAEASSPRSSADVLDIATDLAVELRTGVRYGASALRAASADGVDDEVKAATGGDGWLQQLRLLLAVEEIVAIELALAASRVVDSSTCLDESPATRVLLRLADERTAYEGLGEVLDAVKARVPKQSGNPIKKLAHRSQLNAWQQIDTVIDAYRQVTSRIDDPAPATVTADADKVIEEFDAVAVELRTLLSADDAASLLGDYFAAALPTAREEVAALRQRHPTEDTKALVARVKRQAIADMGRQARIEEKQSTSDIVVLLAMEVAVLRGVEPRSEAEFAEIGRRIVDRAMSADAWHKRVGAAMPLVVAGFEKYAKDVQPMLVELVFNAMTGVKPAQAGVAKDLYKAARSNIWRARYNKGVARAAALGASRGLQIVVSSGTARLLVRQVDRALAV